MKMLRLAVVVAFIAVVLIPPVPAQGGNGTEGDGGAEYEPPGNQTAGNTTDDGNTTTNGNSTTNQTDGNETVDDGNSTTNGNDTTDQTTDPDPETDDEPPLKWVFQRPIANAANTTWVFVTDNIAYGFSQDQDNPRLKRLGNEFTVYIFPDGGEVGVQVLLDGGPQTLSNGIKTILIDGPHEEFLEVPKVRGAKLEVRLTYADGREETVDFGTIRFVAISAVAREVEDEGLRERDPIWRQFSRGEFAWFATKQGITVLFLVGLAVFAGWQRGLEKEEGERPILYGE